MKTLKPLLDNNKRWSAKVTTTDPTFFRRLSEQQSPEYLWIGCSDSRVPANEIVDLLPGELFVHRNVANVVVHTDLNCLSVIQYAVDVLKVKHIIVCGHYGCGGVHAALQHRRFGLIDNWLRHIQDIHDIHRDIVSSEENVQQQTDRLCELNVIEQVSNVCETTIVQDAWARGHSLSVHGWIYGLQDGIIRDLNVTIQEPGEMQTLRDQAVAAVSRSAQARKKQ